MAVFCQCGHPPIDHRPRYGVTEQFDSFSPVIHGSTWLAECQNREHDRRGCTCQRYKAWTDEQVEAMLR